MGVENEGLQKDGSLPKPLVHFHRKEPGKFATALHPPNKHLHGRSKDFPATTPVNRVFGMFGHMVSCKPNQGPPAFSLTWNPKGPLPPEHPGILADVRHGLRGHRRTARAGFGTLCGSSRKPKGNPTILGVPHLETPHWLDTGTNMVMFLWRGGKSNDPQHVCLIGVVHTKNKLQMLTLRPNVR